MRDWRQYTYDTLNDLDLYASKKKGQNFLIRYRVADQIVRKANVMPGDHILEIGGGVGILTDALAKTGAKITVIEKEPKLAEHLRQTFEEFDQINVIEDDALLNDWPENVKIVSNLPYSISTPILDKIVHHSISKATVMLQREVGIRCVASPGDNDYSRLSVLTSIHGKTNRLMDVSSDSFFPKPRVSSTVIQFSKLDKGFNNKHEDLEELATNLFSLKRRIVRKVVRGFLKRQDVGEDSWEKCPFKKSRIFNLSVHQMDEILTHLKSNDAWPLAQPVS